MNLQPPDPPEDTRDIGDVLNDVIAENAELRRKLAEQQAVINECSVHIEEVRKNMQPDKFHNSRFSKIHIALRHKGLRIR